MGIFEARSDDALRHRLNGLTAGAADTCYECDICSASCAWSLFGTDEPDVLRLIGEARGDESARTGSDESLWTCTTCGSCDLSCPQGVSVSDVLLAFRTLSAEAGRGPRVRDRVMRQVLLSGNPSGAGPGEREELDAAAPLPPIEPGGTRLLYLGAPVSHDPRLRRIATAMAALLEAAGVEFGVLDHEPESGDMPRLLGERGYFEKAATRTLAEFERLGVREIVTLSPHDYDAFTRLYPRSGAPLRVFHATQYLDRLLGDGGLEFEADRQARVLYHDPCYLGRRHGVYEQPRRLLRAMPGLELEEFEEYGEQARCCGGGGARIWLQPEAGEDFATRRVLEARERGVDYIVTACPSCIQMFEDALASEGLVGPQVRHLVELAASWGPQGTRQRHALEGAAV